MLIIRLQRTGRENVPSFRVVVSEKARSAKKGTLEILGHYQPAQKDGPLVVKADRILYWISKGSQVSNTMARLLKRQGVEGMDKFIKRYTKQRKKGEEEAKPAEAAPAAAPVVAPAEAKA